MTVLSRTCLALVCDVCQDGWIDGEPHFATLAEAARHAAGAGWLVGATGAVCPGCRAVQACARRGHQWGPWLPAGPFPRVGGGIWQGRVCYCRGCTSARWVPP